MKAIILAAGFATRMHPLTLDTAKGLLPLHGKRVMDFTTERIISAQEIEETAVVSNACFADAFRQWIDTNYPGRRLRLIKRRGGDSGLAAIRS